MGVEDDVIINKPCVDIMERTSQMVVEPNENNAQVDNDVVNLVVEAPRSGPGDELYSIQSNEWTGVPGARVCGEYKPTNYEPELLDFEPYVGIKK